METGVCRTAERRSEIPLLVTLTAIHKTKRGKKWTS